MKTIFRLLAGAALLLSAETASACATCMGAADSQVGPALNASMGFLLVIVGVVAAAFFWFLIYLARRDGHSLE